MTGRVTMRRRLAGPAVNEAPSDLPGAPLKLWLLLARGNLGNDDPWNPWYDTAQGFVVRATNEQQARQIAAIEAGDESRRRPDAWTNPKYSTCEELTPYGEPEMILRDFNAA